MNDQSVLVELDQIQDNPYQMRVDYDAEKIRELAVDIATNTLLQVPAARRVNGHYELVYGHRRKRALEVLATTGVPELGIAPDPKYKFMPLQVRELDDFQMFDDGLSENLKRDDLKTTERARAIQKYLDFGKSSKEAAVKFGLGSDATVRGLVRLLDLPEEVHAKIDDGSITQGTARSLLSMQKIAPKETIIATVNKIEKNKNNSLPEDVIEGTIQRLEDVVEMWDEDRKNGKPRSSYRSGWLLDMKNFPNKLLPALTPVDAAIALGIQDNEKAMKLVSEYLECVDGLSVAEPTDDPKFIEDVKAHAQTCLDKITKLSPEYVARLQHLINPPACTACPFYTKVRGNHFCGIKVCHTRKTVAWETNTVQDASRQLKIEIYEKADGAYQVLSYGDHKLFGSRHKGLRLLPRSQWAGRYHSQYGYTGVDDDAFVVVATGEASAKMNKSNGGSGKSVGGKMTEREKADRRAMRIYRRRRIELLWEYTAAAQTLFDGVPIEALRKLCSWHHIGIDDRIPDEHDHPQTGTDAQKLEFQRRSLVWRLIVGETSHYTRSDLVTLLDRFYKITQVKAPKALLQRAQEWDAEIKAAGKVVSVETPKKKGKKS